MSAYPLEAGEAQPFVPASLRHLPKAPTFYLRWGTPREKERMRWILDEEGCVVHSDEAMRAELLKGLRALLDPADVDLWEPEVKTWWDAIDLFEKENRGTKPEGMPKWEYEGEDRLIEVLEQIAADWHPHRRMNAQNNAYRRMQGHAINSAIIERYENIDVPVRKVGRFLTVDTVMLLADKLDIVGRQQNPDMDGRPAVELGQECVKRMFLSKEQEGNSGSPAPSEAIPDVSATGAASTSGKSKTSARSRKTPATA